MGVGLITSDTAAAVNSDVDVPSGILGSGGVLVFGRGTRFTMQAGAPLVLRVVLRNSSILMPSWSAHRIATKEALHRDERAALVMAMAARASAAQCST